MPVAKTIRSFRKGKPAAAVSNGIVPPRRMKRPLVPPPLKICAECGLKSSSHLDNLEHWRKVPELQNQHRALVFLCTGIVPVCLYFDFACE